MKLCGDPIVDGLRKKMLRASLDRTDDQAVHRVIGKLGARSEIGQAKYHTNLARTDLTHLDWLNHAQEEAMDLADYLEVLISKEPSLSIYDNLQELAISTACILELEIDSIQRA